MEHPNLYFNTPWGKGIMKAFPIMYVWFSMKLLYYLISLDCLEQQSI